MSELKIDDATPDTDVQGNELIPVSDNGTAKSVKVEDIKDFTLEKAAALAEASAVTLGKDGVYIRQGGELKPVPAETFANAVIAAALGKAAASDLSGSESVVVKSGGAAKTATLADIAAYVKTVIVGLAASFDIDGLAATTAAAALKVPVSETDASGNASNKSLTLSDIKKFIAPTDSLTLCPTTASGDVILAIDSDKKWKGLPNTLFTDKSITTPTANSVTAGQLVKFADKTGSAFAGGPSVVAKVRTSNSASASDVPTEAAVRSAIDAGTPDATTEGNIPTCLPRRRNSRTAGRSRTPCLPLASRRTTMTTRSRRRTQSGSSSRTTGSGSGRSPRRPPQQTAFIRARRCSSRIRTGTRSSTSTSGRERPPSSRSSSIRQVARKEVAEWQT